MSFSLSHAHAVELTVPACQSNGRLEVDIPFRELGFQGVPFRSNVLLQPTTETLVFLTEPPFLVLTLSEIEIAHLERVQYGLKNFDLVFVFQDFNRAPVHINTIPMNQLDTVKEWLEYVLYKNIFAGLKC